MKNTISFWELITTCEKGICIPRIQRDYAQGRVGKEFLRKRLLGSFQEALDNPEQPLLLDFIYGSREGDGRYYPLDGQQRLTTLWLLHWYIAYRAKALTEVNRNYLKKFSYETRRSSADFCRFLCDLEYSLDTTKPMRDYISSQTRFSAKWALDPTVFAMLNTLCGTDETDENQNDIVDGLCELFDSTSDETFQKYWDILSSKECPIRFYNLDMAGENLPLSDDLYIKMNARGKQLSDWENFKADLLDFADDRDALGHEIDNCWTDLFWRNHKGGKVDAILFAFVNRYIFNEYLIDAGNKRLDPTKYGLYKLYGKEGNDTVIRYVDFLSYNGDAVCAAVTKDAVNRLRKVVKKISAFAAKSSENWNSIRSMVQASWSENSTFEFIPTYTADDASTNISAITLNQRLVFLAACRYFEKVEVEEFNTERFKDWVRFTWNISQYIRTDAISNAFVLIDEKSEYCADILHGLNNMDIASIAANSFARDQLKEEIEKARYILSSDSTRKDAIFEAEKYRDLHGHINFLFYDENGDVQWEHFDAKFDRLKVLFGESASKDDATLKEPNILKVFLSYCTSIAQIESWSNNYSYIYDYSWESWRSNFSHSKYRKPTHKVLISEGMRDVEDAVNAFKPGSDNDTDIYKSIYEWMLRTDFLDYVAKKLKSGRQRPYLRRYNGGVLCMYPSAEGINMEREDRDTLIQTLYNEGSIELAKDDIFSDPQSSRLFLKGWGISFKYKEHKNANFYWSWDNTLYINNEKYKQIEVGISEKDFIDLLNSAIRDLMVNQE